MNPSQNTDKIHGSGRNALFLSYHNWETKRQGGLHLIGAALMAQAISEHLGKRLAAVVLGCQAESLRRNQTIRSGSVAVECAGTLVYAGQYSGHYMDDLAARNVHEAGDGRCRSGRRKECQQPEVAARPDSTGIWKNGWPPPPAGYGRDPLRVAGLRNGLAHTRQIVEKSDMAGRERIRWSD